MAKKSKKAEEPMQDKLLRGFSIVGALLSLPLVVPQLPWRKAAMDSNLGSRFTTERVMSPFTVSNHMQQGITWLRLSTEMCNKMKQLSMPNPTAALIGSAASLFGAGGSITGCAGWTLCKSHAAARCSAYRTLAFGGIFCLLLILVGSCCSMITVVFLSMEGTKKKKKEKEEAAQKTMASSIASFVLVFMGVTAWLFLSDTTFKGLKTTGYYPYPGAYIGLYMGALGIFVLFFPMYLGITRIYPNPLFKSKGAAKEEEEEYVTDMYGRDMLLPDMYSGQPLPEMYNGQPGTQGDTLPPMMNGGMPPGMGHGEATPEAQGDRSVPPPMMGGGLPAFMQ